MTPGFMRNSATLWARGQDTFLVFRGPRIQALAAANNRYKKLIILLLLTIFNYDYDYDCDCDCDCDDDDDYDYDYDDYSMVRMIIFLVVRLIVPFQTISFQFYYYSWQLGRVAPLPSGS